MSKSPNKTIAFVPARGGSKSIPLKNIKLFCGKPLIFWNLEALQNCNQIDEVFLATDSEEIAKLTESFAFDKVKVFMRSPENAQDTSSTESVMLEFLAQSNYRSDDRFILVQATSPLTESHHFTEAIQQLETTESTSLLSAVRTKRFYWNFDGTPINYDFNNRPRRQDFDGWLMENGAFYINSVAEILAHKNRLSGKISIYEMPEHTAVEIDEPDDWALAEKMMNRHVISKRKAEKRPQIKLFITDVDGVLTDAGMYYSEGGDELKKFNTHDGKGIQLLREAGLKTAIITSENTKIVERRAAKLKVDYLFQGIASGKLEKVKLICEKEGLSLNETAYIGDDINDLDALEEVGLPACPHNALPKVKSISGILQLQKSGGEGAVREFAEYILEHCIG